MQSLTTSLYFLVSRPWSLEFIKLYLIAFQLYSCSFSYWRIACCFCNSAWLDVLLLRLCANVPYDRHIHLTYCPCICSLFRKSVIYGCFLMPLYCRCLTNCCCHYRRLIVSEIGFTFCDYFWVWSFISRHKLSVIQFLTLTFWGAMYSPFHHRNVQFSAIY